MAKGQKVLDRIATREGLISSLWQAWCRFFRSVIITSVGGGTTSNGVPITSHFHGLSEAELMYVAKQLSVGAAVKKVKPIAGPHLEPTWGDIDKAISISGGMGLSNGGQLITSLALASSIQDLQMCRNATAHLGPHQIVELGLARVRYADTKLFHPTDAAIWIDPGTDGYLWDTWVEEIRDVARSACL